MKTLNVLLTCSSFHAIGIIKCLKNNPDKFPCRVFATNCNHYDLPPLKYCDGVFVVPKLDDDSYIPTLLDICNAKEIDVILPTSSLELEVMARNKSLFENRGIKVSVSSLESILISGDKVSTFEKLGKYMPKQKVAHNAIDVLDFALNVPSICCKAISSCGGKGFAVVDEDKCTDVSYFHAFGKKHYISLWQLCRAIERNPYPMILQEHCKGIDYSIAAMAVNGKVTHVIGCYGTTLEFGAIMRGKIDNYPYAMEIANVVATTLGIDGIFGLDFILQSDGTAILLDVNMRVTASAEFYAEAGVNLPWIAIKHTLGYDISKDCATIDFGLEMVKYFDAQYFHS